MNTTSKLPSVITGACGEHYVAGIPSSGLGLIVAMPRAGIPGMRFVGRDFKGRSGSPRSSERQELNRDQNRPGIGADLPLVGRQRRCDQPQRWESLQYAYVWSQKLAEWRGSSEVFFVPSKVVVECTRQLIHCTDNEWAMFCDVRPRMPRTYEGKSGFKLLSNTL